MRLWLDNTELEEAADLFEERADRVESKKPDQAGADRDTARALRDISQISLDGKPIQVRPGVMFPAVLITIRGTSEGTATQRREECKSSK